jgi:hypothetical protein
MKPIYILSSRIREIMEAICRIQQLRSDEWNRIKAEALSKLPSNTASMYEANGVAYAGTQDKTESIDKLLQTLFEDTLQLKDEDILNGDPATIERLLVFLNTDIPAFQCGYAKEYYLRILKKANLTTRQHRELQALVLFHCNSQHFRREHSTLARLAILIADAAFIRQLQLLSVSPSERTRLKAKFMLDRICNGRIDLRTVTNNNSLTPLPKSI